ncbi:MAG: EpsG family protein [Abditibacteriota bacterium]|nr:EpsG family protein [Abditibacteriota bacterium]
METYFVFGTYFAICIMYMYTNTEILANNNLRLKKIVVTHLGVLIFLLGALRNQNTGSDTHNYCLRFINQSGSLLDIFNEAIKYVDSEKAYYILAAIFRYFTDNPQVWLAVSCLVFIIPCAILIYKHSDNPAISYIYIVALLIYQFTWQGLRQEYAMATCLIATMFLIKKKWVWFVILFILAFMFHRTAVVFLLVLIAFRFKPNVWGFLLVVGFFFLSYISPFSVNLIIARIFGDTDFAGTDKVLGYAASVRSGSSYKLFAVLFVFYIISYACKDGLIKRNPLNGFFINMSLIGCCFQALAVGIPEFFRLAYYFSIFNMLLVPNVCEYLQERNNRLPIRLITVAMLIAVYFLTGGFKYWFMWEQGPWM